MMLAESDRIVQLNHLFAGDALYKELCDWFLYIERVLFGLHYQILSLDLKLRPHNILACAQENDEFLKFMLYGIY